MQRHRLSIILPVYNVEAYLDKCLSSIFTQDLTECEIIVVNDGSTDGSINIIKEFEQKYSNLIVIEKINGGISSARNYGLKKATGDYVFFLDSDDYLLPFSISHLLSLMKTEIEVLSFNAKIDTGENYIQSLDIDNNTVNGMQYIMNMDKIHLSLPAVPVWLYLYKRAFLVKNQITFIESVIHEDNHFTLKVLSLAESVVFNNISIVHHRVGRPKSITSNLTIFSVNSLQLIARDLYYYFVTNQLMNQILRKKIFLLYIFSAARLVTLQNSKQVVLTKEDASIMDKCLFDSYWYFHLLLLKKNLIRIYKWYVNSNSLVLKKYIRRVTKFVLIILNRRWSV